MSDLTIAPTSPIAVDRPFGAQADVPTEAASRYLQQLCKHFAHKLPTTFDATAGRIDFPMGPATLAAGPKTLHLAVACGSAEDLATLKDVVVRHLVRFAFRETLDVVWTDTAPAA